MIRQGFENAEMFARQLLPPDRRGAAILPAPPAPRCSRHFRCVTNSLGRQLGHIGGGQGGMKAAQ